MDCQHSSVACLNEFELVRKYRCSACGEVMMCACDRDVGERFLSHQLRVGTDLRTKERHLVTKGFVNGICRECRGLPPEAHPMAEIHGRTSKILRYYWRELAFMKYRLRSERMDRAGSSGPKSEAEQAQSLQEVEQEALARIKRMHETSPKYVYAEESQDSLLTRLGIEVVRLDAHFTPKRQDEKRKGLIADAKGECSAEEFVESHYGRDGWNCMRLESRPFHVLFGVFLWLLVQDPADERGRMAGFGCKRDYAGSSLHKGEQLWTQLPEDFGAPGFAERRAAAIDEHFTSIMNPEAWTLLELFDYWLEPSTFLRDYLWAHDDDDIARARRLLEIIPEAKMREILGYLVGDYWRRYLGWPDLILWKGEEFFLAEVKASRDSLSQDQKGWLRDNTEILKLPFKLVKIHRIT